MHLNLSLYFTCNSNNLPTCGFSFRFYPKFKLGPILASIEAQVVPCDLSIWFLFLAENIFNIILPAMQPGYGASAVDFHITKSEVLKDKIVRIDLFC